MSVNVTEMIAAVQASGERWDGLLPGPLQCRECGCTLNADGTHTAEVHAGCYTGLCDRCTGRKPYVIETLPDGAQRWSFPPALKAFRRDRWEAWAYPDCEECKGTGKSATRDGYCGPCAQRVATHSRLATRALVLAVADRLEACELDEGDAFEVVRAAIAQITREVLPPMLEVPHRVYEPVVPMPFTSAQARLGRRRFRNPDALRTAYVAELRVEAAGGAYTTISSEKWD